jgi:DNA-binding MarR family transcriptional regulator
VDPARLEAGVQELRARGLVEESAPRPGDHPRRSLTAAGCAVLDRLAQARRAHLSEVIAEWDPEKRAELAAAMPRLAEELVPEPLV